MLKKSSLFVLFLLSIQHTNGAELKTNYKDFVPNKWKVLEEVRGDFNGDHLSDIAMIIEDTHPKNVITNEGLGNPELNTNPRKLLVLLNTPKGYKAIVSNITLPTEGSLDNPCLTDPLDENNALEVKNNLLKIHLHYWLSCGSWFTTNITYTFRYQNSTFKLIGYDSSSFHRATGDISEQSINFLTRKIKNTSNKNEFDHLKSPPKIQWNTLKNTYNLNLNNINFNEYYEFE